MEVERVKKRTGSPGPLRVSANGRYLVGRDDRPFFWLGDLGGDDTPDTKVRQGVWHSLARGIAEAIGGSEDYCQTLMTYSTPDGWKDAVLPLTV